MLQEQIKAKVSTLKTIINYCEELKKLRNNSNNLDELEEVKRFAESQLEHIKQLVTELNSK